MTMRYIAEDGSLKFKFNTVRFSTGAPHTLAGTPSLAVYPEDSTTQITSGITLTVDYDSKTGLNDVVIDLSASASYAAGKKYEVQIEAGTVDSVSVVGMVVYEFYIVAAGGLEAAITRSLLALPPVAYEAAGGLYTRGSGAGQINQPANGMIDVNLVRLNNNSQSLLDLKDFVDDGYDPTTNRVAGVADLESDVNALGIAIADIDSVVTNGTHGNAAIKALIDILQTSVTNLHNLSAKCNLFGPAVMEIPDSGSTVFSFKMVVRDDEDKLVNLDGTPTLIATNAAGDNRAANLSAVSNPSTGEYAFTYTVADSHLSEAMIIEASGTISAEARKAYYRGFVADYDQGTTINTILTNLNALITTAGTPSNFGSGASLARNLVDTYALLEGVDDTTLQTQSNVNTLMGRITATLFSGITSLGDWIRRFTRKDAGTAGMTTALNEINTGGASTYSATDNIENILDTGSTGPWTTGGGGGAGSGARTVAVTVDDGTDPLESARVRVTKGAETYVLSTDVNGECSFSLDDGTWAVAVTLAGYSFTPTTLVVNGDETVTYSMSLIAIAPPANPAAISAVYVLLDGGLANESGVTIYWRMIAPDEGAGIGFQQVWNESVTNGSGIATFAVIPGAEYEFAIASLDGCKFRYVIPDDAVNGHLISPKTVWQQ